MTPSTLSVVIVSWNTRELLRKCLASLESEAQRLPHWKVECLVVDNGSSDGSPEMVRQDFSWVTLIRNEKNPGFAAANNQALSLCKGRYVLLLNPDTELRDGALAVMVARLDDDPQTGAVGARLIGADGTVQDSCFPAPALSREAWRLLGLDRLYPVSVYPVRRWSRSDKARRVDCIQGACILLRSKVLYQIGYFDEQFFIYSEEADLCRRIRSAGWLIYWLPSSEVVHHGGQSTRQVAPEMFLELYRSKLQYFRKHEGQLGGVLYKLILLIAISLRVSLPPVLALFSPSDRQRLQTVMSRYRLLLSALPSL